MSNLRPITDPSLAGMLASTAAALQFLQPLRPHGMSAVRHAILGAIGESAPAGLTAECVARATALKVAVVREHVTALKWRGLVRLDGGTTLLLTTSGQALFEEYRPVPQPELADIFPTADVATPTDVGRPAAEPTPTGLAAGHPLPVAPSAPARTAPPPDRRQQIREVARRLAAAGRPSRLPLVTAPKPEDARPAPRSDWIAERVARIQGAIAFLRTKGVLVQVDNPDTLVRLYRMTGNFNRYTAEQVIARAERLGWEGIAQ